MSTLNIDIVARFAQLTDALSQVDRKVSKSAAGMEKAFGNLKGVLASLGVGLSVGGIAAFVKSAINVQDEIGKMSQKIGVSAEGLSALSYSASLANVPLETLQQSLKKLSVGMVETQANTGESKEAFKALGISVEATKGNLKSSERVLFELADKFAGMEDSAGKTALAVKIFGRAGAEMIPLLNAGSKGLRENAEEAKRFGIIISTDATKKAEQFNDNLTRITAATKGFAIAIANPMLPALNSFVERLLEANRIGGSFLGTLQLLGKQSFSQMINTPAQNIKNLTAEMEALQKGTFASSLRTKSGGTDPRIDDIKKQIEWEKVLQRQQAMRLEGGDTPGERARAAQPLAQAPKLPNDSAIKRAEQLLEKYRDKLRGIGDEMLKLEGIDSDFLKMKSLIATDKDFKAMSNAQKTALLDAAELLDLNRDRLKQNKELEDGLAVDAKARSEASNKEIADLVVLANKYKDLADPLREIAREHQKIDELVKDGWISQGVADVSKLSSELRGLLAPVKNIHDEIQKAWEAGVLTTEQMVAATDRLAVPLEKVKNISEDFGHAISTAFEDAIIEGKKAIDVLKAFGTTIAQIIFRQQVTKPFEKAIGGLDFGGIFKNLLSGFGFGGSTSSAGLQFDYNQSFATGTDYVPRTGMYQLHQGEAVIPAGENMGGGVTYAPTFNVDSRTDRADVIALMRREDQRTVFTIADMTRRGGGYSKAVRG